MARHVIEHIANPHFLVRECSKINGENIRLFIETPDFHWIIKNKAFEDIAYEHCSFFSHNSIAFLLKAHDFALEFFDTVFTGQYMWIEASNYRHKKFLQEYCNSYSDFSRYWHSVFADARKEERQVFVWGAGAKGVNFCNMLDKTGQLINGVIDIKKTKWNNYIAGSGHKIYPPAILKKYEPIIIVMNENYLEEVRKKIFSLGIKNAVLMTLHN